MDAKKNSNDLTFIIQIKGTANHTWQGVIKWADTEETTSFRSALEMLQLIDSATKKNS